MPPFVRLPQRLSARPGRLLVPAIVGAAIAGAVAYLLSTALEWPFGWTLLLAASLGVVPVLLVWQRRQSEGGSTTHRLEAVLFADIVDYTALASRNEPAALRLVHVFQAVARELAHAFDGRVVKFLGDGALMGFGSSEAAIRASDAFRQDFPERARRSGLGTPAIRIGVHVGDVAILPDGDLYGDGVNGAARLQAAAEPGQVLVSDDVWRQLHRRPELEFRELGERQLKGVPDPVRVFGVESVGGKGVPDDRGGPPLPAKRWALIPVWALVLAVLVSLAAIYLTLRAPGSSPPGVTEAAAALPGVAVLPFQVSGAGLDGWDEGMMDLLSTNFDGVTGLRAIDGRTVLARWRESVSSEGPPEVGVVLDVAERTGATYAVLGSAVAIGGGVRIVADVYDIPEDIRLGRTQVEGARDSVFQLVDRVSIDLLKILPGSYEDAANRVSLARVTTDSLEALKAYLRGQVLFRRSDFRGAFEAYGRAVEIDSTFAQALYRMGLAAAWVGADIDSEVELTLLERAARLPDRLTERERIVLDGVLLSRREDPESIAILERATRLYPGDLLSWFELGEAYYHFGSQALLDATPAEQAFARVTEIDSLFAPAYIHLIELAFGYQADSLRARHLVSTYEELAHGSRWTGLYRLGYQLAFGDSAARSEARAKIAAIDPLEVQRVIARGLYWHPRLRPLQEELASRPSEPAVRDRLLVDSHFAQGEVAAARRILDRSGLTETERASWRYMMHAWGVASDLPAPSPPREDVVSTFYSGAWAIDRGRWGAYDSALQALRRTADSLETAGHVVEASFALGTVHALEGYAAWKRGEPEEAERLLRRGQREATGFFDVREDVNATIRLWLGKLLVERERTDEAIGVFRSFWGVRNSYSAPAHLELGRLHEAAGRTGEARRAYRYFVESWQGADRRLQPLVESVRERLDRLR